MMFSITLSDENSAPPWNSTPVCVSIASRLASSSASASMPNTRTEPACGRRRPRMARISTDLPEPEPPTTPTISPLFTVRSTPSWTTCEPKAFTSPRTSIAGVEKSQGRGFTGALDALTSPSP